MSYRDSILKIAPDCEPRHVEAWMRVEHPTLDHLSPARFKGEVKIALQCIAEAGAEQSEKLAQSYGL